MAEEGLDFGFSHIPGVAFGAEKADEAGDPVAVGLFGAIGVVVVAQHLAGLVQELQIGVGAKFRLVSHIKI